MFSLRKQFGILTLDIEISATPRGRRYGSIDIPGHHNAFLNVTVTILGKLKPVCGHWWIQ